MSAALRQIAERIRAASGLVLEGPRIGSLGSALRRLDLGPPDAVLARLADPQEGPALTARLVDAVAVKETFFFRHDDELRALDWPALLAQARRRGDDRVRVWCTACATGEEAYSLAVLALEALGPAAAVDVLGTDISEGAIERARAGRYRPRAVASVAPELRARWFEAEDGGLRVAPPLRRVVRFAVHNLVAGTLPPPGEVRFDVITCRNVLIYFSAEQAQRTIHGLSRALVPGGRLVLGAADRLSTGTVGRIGPPEPARPRPAGPPRARRRRRPEPEPPDAAACLEHGRAARARGDHADAVRWLRRALYLDPDCGVAGLELALAYGAQGDETAARRALWTAIRATEPPRSEDDDELLAECRTRLAALGAGQDDGGGP